MKNLKAMFTVVALVFISGAVTATGNLKVNVIPGEKNETVVRISNVNQSHYEIELENENGDIVFYKETNSPSTTYSKLYDFSMLEDGKYNFTVKVENEKEVNRLKIKNGKVEVLNQWKEVEPFFTMKDNRLELSYLNFGQKNVKLMVYDGSTQELLYEKKLDSDFAINYGLDFSKLKSGKYDAVLASENNFYGRVGRGNFTPSLSQNRT
jgi:hypothetical protein